MSRTRDRHGRGLRGAIAPPGVPLTRSAAQGFDDALLDVLDHLEGHGLTELQDVEFAVEEVPDVPAQPGLDTAVLEDGGVPLARTVLPGTGAARDEKPTVVLFRRPIVARAIDDEDLEDLLHEVVIDRLANLLGRDPDELDPHT